jgi:hypothetical protein
MTRVVLYLVTTLREENSPPTSKRNAFPATPLCIIPSAMISLVIWFPYKIDHGICIGKMRCFFVSLSQFNVDFLEGSESSINLSLVFVSHLIVLVHAADFIQIK